MRWTTWSTSIGRYQLQPQTIGVLGFQFRETDYTGNQPIGQSTDERPAV